MTGLTGLRLAMTAQAWHRTPSTYIGLSGVDAFLVDEALATRLMIEARKALDRPKRSETLRDDERYATDADYDDDPELDEEAA